MELSTAAIVDAIQYLKVAGHSCDFTFRAQEPCYKGAIRPMGRREAHETMPEIADFTRYERDLFGLYTRYRYNEEVCRRLTRKAMRLEKWVRRSVLITLAVSLLSGVIPGMSAATLNWVWGSLTTAATLLTIYSLFEGSGEKQFRWFQLAMRFRSSADQVEFFSDQVRRGKITEDELSDSWHKFRQELGTLIDGAGVIFLEFEEEHKDELTEAVEATLRREHRAS